MILITAPAGNIGSQVLAALAASNEAIRVVARHPSRLPAEVRSRVEVVEGSHGDPETVTRALDGVRRVFWLVPGDMTAADAMAAYVDFTRPAAEALKTGTVTHVVAVSALGRGWPRDAGHVTATLEADDLIAETGVAFRALACASLMENQLRQLAQIRDHGVLSWPADGDRPFPHVATRDVAALAARLLLDPAWDGAEEIPMTGPQDVSFNAIAAIMTEVLGRPVRFEEMRTEDLRAMLAARGASAGMAQAMVDMLTAKNEGLDHMGPRSTPADTPTDIHQWCTDVLKPAIAG
ncbi:NmrA family transcriptional regulator [Acuticoccus sediminis]|uniref:NmrA family transcriptional regulator n=1 Tax=Acuticoccus sediminis TaxID=2184697 RepID=A0A8B2NVN8_9HYPH|nr:NAD(P)H-binding protein [Acuticoccus sediminis]RAI01823.1 NmrA family transcriptional regulator [Acuticoccus sediminis]